MVTNNFKIFWDMLIIEKYFLLSFSNILNIVFRCVFSTLLFSTQNEGT